MSFARPDLLWLTAALPLGLLALIALYVRRRERVARALGGDALADRLAGVPLARRPLLRAGLVLLAGLALGIAAATPRWGFAVAEGQSRALNLVLALDASNSMLARDVEPDRLARERLLASRLLRELAGDRIGLVAFAGRGYVLAPLTVDHSALQLYLDALDPGIVSAGGTAISSGLRQATDLVRGEGGGGARVVILISDGEALEDRSAVIEAAERAAAAGVIVHTVGVGTTEGARVPEVDPQTGRVTGYIRDVDGSMVVSRLDEELLTRVADLTGGVYVRLGTPGATERLLSAVSSLERARIDAAGRRLEPKRRTGWFLALALVCLAAEAGLARRESAALPRRRG